VPLPPGVSLSSIQDCTLPLGTLTYNVGSGSIASINGETNQITAEQPGTTVVTASVAGGASSAGYFSTCPPASIDITLANGATSGTITQGVQQNLTTTVIDTQGNPITGLTLDYQSTDPFDIAVGATAAWPPTIQRGVGLRYLPAEYLQSIADQRDGANNTGLPISSNP